jgi:hypothetical protein
VLLFVEVSYLRCMECVIRSLCGNYLFYGFCVSVCGLLMSAGNVLVCYALLTFTVVTSPEKSLLFSKPERHMETVYISGINSSLSVMENIVFF